MKTVNLLPKWYMQQQRQWKNLRVHLGIMILVGAGMVGASFAGREHIALLTTHREQLAARRSQIGDPNLELQVRRAELKNLENLQLAYRELGNTIPMSAVIQQILNDMTVGMALSRFTIDVHAEAVRGSGLVGDSRHPPKIHNVAHLVVVGVAPNDVLIAQLIGKLSGNPLFSNVSLNYTHTELLADHAIRRFEIQMDMELERLSTGEPQSAKPTLQAQSGGPPATGGPNNAG